MNRTITLREVPYKEFRAFLVKLDRRNKDLRALEQQYYNNLSKTVTATAEQDEKQKAFYDEKDRLTFMDFEFGPIKLARVSIMSYSIANALSDGNISIVDNHIVPVKVDLTISFWDDR